VIESQPDGADPAEAQAGMRSPQPPGGPQAFAVRVTEGGARRVYTRRLRTAHVAILLVLTTALALGPPSELIAGDHALAVTIASVTFLAGLLGCFAILRRSVVVTPGLVTIRGLLTTRRVPAADVARFEPPPPYGKVLGRVALRVVLMDGQVRHSGCFTNTEMDRDGAGREECAELNAWLAVQHGSTDQPAALPDRRPSEGGRAGAVARVADRAGRRRRRWVDACAHRCLGPVFRRMTRRLLLIGRPDDGWVPVGASPRRA
jgi:hypothetical protein